MRFRWVGMLLSAAQLDITAPSPFWYQILLSAVPLLLVRLHSDCKARHGARQCGTVWVLSGMPCPAGWISELLAGSLYREIKDPFRGSQGLLHIFKVSRSSGSLYP